LRLRHYVPSVMTAARRVLYETSFLLHALVRTVHDRPDLILCVSPALAGGVAGALIGLRTGAPVVLIVQDLMAKATGESGIIGGRHAAGAASTLERFALSRASETVIVSESFRKPLHAYGIQPARIRLIRNWTHIRPATVSKQEARRALNWPEDDFLAVHTGNMGFKQDLENIIRASEESVESQVRYVLVGDGSQRTSLEAQAVGNPAIWFVNPVDEDTYPLVLAAADVLLLNERESVSNMSLPSKLTSYMVAGRPIVAAVAEGGATWRELTLAGAGLVVPAGNPTRLAQAIEHLRDDEELRSALSRAARTHAEHELSASSSLKEIVRLAKELTAGRVASRPSVTRTLLNRGWGRRV
jgi:colanic acid biosynthesis glycosyl transferase WcaI